MAAPKKRTPPLVRLLLFVLRHSCVFSILCFVIAAVWIVFLFPTVNVTSGEAKPRGLFVSENALQTGVHSQAFDGNDVTYAKQLEAEYARFAANASPAVSPLERAGWFADAAATGAGAAADTQHFTVTCAEGAASCELSNWVAGGGGGRVIEGHNAYAVLPARAGAAGAPGALLLTAPLPPLTPVQPIVTASSGGSLVHPSFLLLALLKRVSSLSWRGKDIVLVLLDDDVASGSGSGGSIGGNVALRAWWRAARFDAAGEITAAATDDLLQRGQLFSWLRAMATQREPITAQCAATALAATTATVTATAHSSGSSGNRSSWGSWVQPLKHTIPQVWLAACLAEPAVASASAAAAESAVEGGTGGRFAGMGSSGPQISTAVLTHGAGGQVPEIDTVMIALKSLQTPHVVMQPGAAAGATASLHTALSKRFARLRQLLHTHRGAVQDVLDPVSGAISVISTAAGGGGIALDMGSVEVWLQRLSELCHHSAKMLVGSGSGPHAELLVHGIQAVTLQPLINSAASPITAGDARQYSEQLGRSLEKWLRTGTGLDERLHASLSFYILMGKEHFVGLTEYAMPAVMFHVPVLLAAFSRTPSLPALGAAAAAAMLAAGAGGLSWLLLMQPQPQQYWLSTGLVNSITADASLQWLLLVSLLQLVLVVAVFPALRAALLPTSSNSTATKATSSAEESVNLSPSVAAHFLAWLLLGYAQFPLLYLHPPLHFALAACVGPVLLALTAINDQLQQRKASVVWRTVARLLWWCVWLTVSPAGLCLLLSTLSAPAATAPADAMSSVLHPLLQHLRAGSAAYGLVFPLTPALLLLVLPLHTLLAL